MVATSATRDAANRDEFVGMVRGELGVDPEVITGEEEAALSFARRGASVPDTLTGRVVVADIGGGSTELVARPGRRVRVAAGAQHGRRLRPDDRAPPARRPADGGPDRRDGAPTCAPRWTRPRATSR